MTQSHYRIGELAKLADISPRTIDYYTKIGLIHASSRSNTNYRMYDDETLDRLRRIELMKQAKYTLEEIKIHLDQWSKIRSDEQVTERLTALQIHLLQLEREVKEIGPVIEQLKPKDAKKAFNMLTPQTAACIEALMLLLGKGPLI